MQVETEFMKRHLCLMTVLLAFGPMVAGAADGDVDFALPRSTPENQGVSSASVLAFIDAIDQAYIPNSFMLVRHGHVVAEGWWAPYENGFNHELYSLSKSFTSTAVGIAIGEGKLSIDNAVWSFFPGDAPPELSENLKAMRVRDLLCMSTGHQDGPSPERDKLSAKAFLAFPVPHKPGTHFLYNTAAAFMLSAIIQKQTGQSVLDYLRPRLFEPLGIAHPSWATNFQGIPLGGDGLRLRTEDIAKFGQLYLQKGRWRGKQLVPAAWVDAATARQTSNGSNPNSDFEQGYGYQFWRVRHGSYCGMGWNGQYCLVLPEQDAVIAITGGSQDLNVLFNLIWDRLLPALQPSALPPDASSRKALQTKLTKLSLSVAQGNLTSPLRSKIVGKKYVFPQNKEKLELVSIVGDPSDTGLTLETRANGIEQRLALGQGTWTRTHGLLASLPDEPLATRAIWTSEDTLTVNLCASETPFWVTLTFRFDGNRLIRERQPNMSLSKAIEPRLVGVAE
jgi:CubicO group peptidase (beta-lactamase class C family)